MRKYFHMNNSSVHANGSSTKFITRENFYVYGVYVSMRTAVV